MEAFFLLAFASALILLTLNFGLRMLDSLSDGDVGLIAVDGVRTVVCASGAIALVAIAIGRLA
ncbi:hypothetical protein [Methylobacterium sp. WL120]|uniref:hypothetical protein n=1 Tax=Methylobacterium sp. WL120 TaxID=2603887 RepID=UPI0011C7DE74|nr:hypothetical protein [Methylobacterium sp. WL120]TXM65756.1 hypothetical protein FV229_14785 [Methylobacterium sp. WL120]